MAAIGTYDEREHDMYAKTGKLDGRGRSITNLQASTSLTNMQSQEIGLFAYTSHAIFTNLNIKKIAIDVTVLRDCVNRGDASIRGSFNRSACGIARSYSISNCDNHGSIESDGAAFGIGCDTGRDATYDEQDRLVDETFQVISGCRNYGNLYGYYCYGIGGYGVESCVNYGNADSEVAVHGITGEARYAKSCKNYGSLAQADRGSNHDPRRSSHRASWAMRRRSPTVTTTAM